MKYVCSLIFITLAFMTHMHAEIQRRAAIHIEADETKLTIADVDTDSNQIVEILADASFAVPYQTALIQAADNTLDQETKELGITVFKEIKEFSDQYQVEQIVAVANPQFHQASDSQAYIQEIEEKSEIKILTPEEEKTLKQDDEKTAFLSLSSEEQDFNKLYVNTYMHHNILLLDMMQAIDMFGMYTDGIVTSKGMLTSSPYWTTVKHIE